MKKWFLLVAVSIAVLCGAAAPASAASEFLDERTMPAFYEPTGVHHFQGSAVLAEHEVPVNEAFAVEYTDCKARESAGFSDPACAALFEDLGFYLLHSAYFWQSAEAGYVPASAHPTADYAVESATLSYDAATRTLSYDLALRYSWTCRGLGCQYAPIVVASLLANFADRELVVYGDALALGQGNYLLTGDGQERYTSVDFASPTASSGSSAIEVHSAQDAKSGSHWKLMLFAHGNAAGFAGADLSAYSRLEFMAATNRAGGVVLQGAFGTGDDSASRGLGSFVVTPEWRKVSLDLSGLDLSDVNTLLWLYLHKGQNPFDFSGVSVFIDEVRLVP